MKMPRISVKTRIAAAALAAALAGGATLVTAARAGADGVTPAQLTAAGWHCIPPRLFPALQLCAPPGTGLPPLPGSAGFADRLPSCELLVFESATGAFLGTELLLRPDIYQQGQPPCPQQPGGQFLYNRAMTPGSATGSASTRPPNRRRRSPERTTERAGAGSPRPLPDSKTSGFGR